MKSKCAEDPLRPRRKSMQGAVASCPTKHADKSMREIEKLCLECVLPRCIETHPRCLIKIARADGLEAARTVVSEAHHKIVITPLEKLPAIVPVKQVGGKHPKPRLRLVKHRQRRASVFGDSFRDSPKPLRPVKRCFHAPSFSGRNPLCVVVRNPASFKIAESAEGVTCRKCLRYLPRYREMIQFVPSLVGKKVAAC